MRTMRVIVICSWALLGSACGCGEPAAAKERSAGPKGSAAEPRAVELATVQRQKLAKTISVSGTLAADEQVRVGVKVAGRLASVDVDLGSVVERGQAIAQVEQTDYQLRVAQAESALAQARALVGLGPEQNAKDADGPIDVDQTSLVQEALATLEEAQANLSRSRTLVEQRLIPQADFDTAKATFVRAESGVAKARDEVRNRMAALRQRNFELRLARQQLADTVVRAPLAGTVQERIAVAGEYLAAGADVATIVRVNPLRMRAEVPERDASLVRAGQRVSVTVEGIADEQVGRVVRLAPALTEQNRSLVIEAEIENPGTLRPGSFARAEIQVDDSDAALVVPASAVVTFAGIDKVITVEKGAAVEAPVTTGRRAGQWIEILKGIEAGTAVVVEPGNLQQGQKVAVKGRR